MTDLRQTAQRAFEALEAGVSISPGSVLHDQFRTALEQQQADPVAWIFTPNNELLWPHEVEATNPIELNSYQPLYTRKEHED